MLSLSCANRCSCCHAYLAVLVIRLPCGFALLLTPRVMFCGWVFPLVGAACKSRNRVKAGYLSMEDIM